MSAMWMVATAGPVFAELPSEHPLYASGFTSEISYENGETVRTPEASATAPSGSNRVFRDVAVPTYALHQPKASKANGIGLVICPGGGYVDVWLDREGHDLAIWLKDYGVTSLVLKYRTNGNDDAGGRKYPWAKYLPARNYGFEWICIPFWISGVKIEKQYRK